MGHGIDYGMGKCNIDPKTGIHYGVIPVEDVMQAWSDTSEPDNGDPTCPKCGEVANAIDLAPENYAEIPGWEDNGTDYTCNNCKYTFDSDEAFGDEPLGRDCIDKTYTARQNQDGDIFIMKSLYYTLAAYCSLCAPGACHLRSPVGDGARAYCFDHEWFNGSQAPYPVFRVSDDSYVKPGNEL